MTSTLEENLISFNDANDNDESGHGEPTSAAVEEVPIRQEAAVKEENQIVKQEISIKQEVVVEENSMEEAIEEQIPKEAQIPVKEKKIKEEQIPVDDAPSTSSSSISPSNATDRDSKPSTSVKPKPLNQTGIVPVKKYSRYFGLESFFDWHRDCPKCSSVGYPHSAHSSRPQPMGISNGNRDCCNDRSAAAAFVTELATLDIDEEMRKQLPTFAALGRCFEKPGFGFIDTHCHLDLLFTREGHDGSMEEYRKIRSGTWAKCFEGCITDFCFPESFMVDDKWQALLQEPNVYGAFGCHPHSANLYTDEMENTISDRLLHDKVIAIGEMGLDYSRNNNVDHDVQKEVFRRQLILGVEKKKPIIIHCRDAEEDAFEIMQEMVPRDHPIHRHCFLGNYDEAMRLIDSFTGLKIGLTTFVASQISRPMMRILREFPLEKILIETDTPYFLPAYFKSPECGNMQWNHPGLGFLVAAKLAHERNMPITDVLKQIRLNTREVYGI